MIDFIKDLFSFTGRWNRLKFWLYPLVISIPLFFVVIGITATMSLQGYTLEAMKSLESNLERQIGLMQEIWIQDGLSPQEIQSTQDYINLSHQLKETREKVERQKSSTPSWTIMVIFQIFTLIWYILYCYIRTVAYIKRLHDLWKSGWLSVLTFVPLISIGMLIWCGFFTGTSWENQYGDNPLWNSTPETTKKTEL